MATNDVYLRPDAGDGTNSVRLRPDAPDSGSITSTLAWASQNDTWAIVSTLLVTGVIVVQSGSDTWALSSGVRVSGSIAVQSGSDTWGLTGAASLSGTVSLLNQNDTWALVSTVTSGEINGLLAWSSESDSWNIAGNAQQIMRGGHFGFDEKKRKKRFDEEREQAEERKRLLVKAFNGLPEQAKPEAVEAIAGDVPQVDWTHYAEQIELFKFAMAQIVIAKAMRDDADDLMEVLEIL